MLRVIVSRRPRGRVRRRLRAGRRAPALVVTGTSARAGRAVASVRCLTGSGAPALVALETQHTYYSTTRVFLHTRLRN